MYFGHFQIPLVFPPIDGPMGVHRSSDVNHLRPWAFSPTSVWVTRMVVRGLRRRGGRAERRPLRRVRRPGCVVRLCARWSTKPRELIATSVVVQLQGAALRGTHPWWKASRAESSPAHRFPTQSMDHGGDVRPLRPDRLGHGGVAERRRVEQLASVWVGDARRFACARRHVDALISGGRWRLSGRAQKTISPDNPRPPQGLGVSRHGVSPCHGHATSTVGPPPT